MDLSSWEGGKKGDILGIKQVRVFVVRFLTVSLFKHIVLTLSMANKIDGLFCRHDAQATTDSIGTKRLWVLCEVVYKSTFLVNRDFVVGVYGGEVAEKASEDEEASKVVADSGGSWTSPLRFLLLCLGGFGGLTF